MIPFPVISGYVFVMLLAARKVYGTVREDGLSVPHDRIDAFMNAVVAFIAGMFWPLALPIAIIMWHPKPTAAETRDALAERDEQNRKLQRRIAELERELGVGAS